MLINNKAQVDYLGLQDLSLKGLILTIFNISRIFNLSNSLLIIILLVKHLDSDSVDAELFNRKLVNGDSFIPSDSQATFVTC